MTKKKIKRLFLQQSYRDAWEDYQHSLKRSHYTRWDYVVFTASNEEQAKTYRMQIERRLEQRVLPATTQYVVLADPDGKRVGSGGATLNVFRYISHREGTTDCFSKLRILIIHSGGDSKRIPQYSACGKLFSPVPRCLPDGRRSTLFDEFMISLSSIPSRMAPGVLVMSGDTLLLFNPLQIDLQQCDAAAISMKEHVSIGKNHGVFLKDDASGVKEFLHKLSEEQLAQKGAVDERGKVYLDTGAIYLSGKVAELLHSLILWQGEENDALFAQYINDVVRLSFYGDFLYPLASGATLEQYLLEKPEGSYSDELTICRRRIWEKLSQIRMDLIALAPSEFIHFGTTHELCDLMAKEIDDYMFLDWKKQILSANEDVPYACNNSLVEPGCQVSDLAYLEDCRITGSSVIGERCVVSEAHLHDVILPDNITVHGIRLRGGRFVLRVYGTDDNPKDTLEHGCIFGMPMQEYLNRADCLAEDLWDTSVHDLWTAKLYPICQDEQQANQCSLWLLDVLQGKPLPAVYFSMERTSLCESFAKADVAGMLDRQMELERKNRVYQMIHAIERREYPLPSTQILGTAGIWPEQIQLMRDIAEESPLSLRMRIYYHLSKLVQGPLAEEFETLCFRSICDDMCQAALEACSYHEEFTMQKAHVKVQLPVRANFGGGWSDTPPYGIENGGTVLNIALSVKGELPIVAEITRLDRPVVVLASTDSGACQEFTALEELQDCQNPFDPFALHKAGLLVSGYIPMKGIATDVTLANILQRMGGGFCLTTYVLGIPRGSGLGTSSILAGAVVKALAEFVGETICDTVTFARVSCLEQIMSTGGGWQDQVGGIAPGLKLITTKPGIDQTVQLEYPPVSGETMEALERRLVLINTGQRRLARNLLREVMGKYIASVPTSLDALEKIQVVARQMRDALVAGDLDGFGSLMTAHWELSKQLDQGSTNTCIDLIFLSCEELLAGKMICGAGGGGFLQVILKEGVTPEMLQDRLNSVFGDSVEVWDCAVWRG